MANKAIILGRLGRDPELRYTPQGNAVATFSIATKGYKDKTEWINIEAWGKLAELCGEYLVKGKEVYFEGRIQTDTWEKDGVTHYKTKVVADKMEFVGSKEVQPAPENYKKSEQPQVSQDDDIPF